ncbi:MAG: hypothetical protein JNJ94_09560 [Chlorobi bacterium]|nr:hypothetical protein [Chlorobiota bacterium]
MTTALQEAMKGIIAANPMNFPPTAKGQCSDQWRVTNSACWKEFHEQITPTYSVTHYQPCFTNNCCYVKLRVCIDQQGNRTASTIPPMDGEPPVINCTPDCPNFICEAQRNTFPPVQNMIKPQHPIQQQEFSTLPNQELNTTVQASETTSAIQNHR